MNRQKLKKLFKIAAVIIVALVIIVILIWWFFFRQIEPPVVNVTPNANISNIVLPATPTTSTPEVTAPPQYNELAVIARNFSERFGSYSNQSNFQNIIDLYPMMTTSFRQSLNLNADEFSQSEYIGVDTKALKVEILEQGASTAKVLVHTQRSQRGKDLQTEVVYQNLELQLVKSSDRWLINNANWQ